MFVFNNEQYILQLKISFFKKFFEMFGMTYVCFSQVPEGTRNLETV